MILVSTTRPQSYTCMAKMSLGTFQTAKLLLQSGVGSKTPFQTPPSTILRDLCMLFWLLANFAIHNTHVGIPPRYATWTTVLKRPPGPSDDSRDVRGGSWKLKTPLGDGPVTPCQRCCKQKHATATSGCPPIATAKSHSHSHHQPFQPPYPFNRLSSNRT